ncbi:MAG: hypothetical protein EZS28_016282 [Streblomastix strix]|uniref:Uncharacterized protein n=1 Tax=Streblomastix strix TaxID=222440 RepID=A0A5J4VZT7_9EUKA|nr:MAG: hypothetical protein EZS28_016282 [Streblomastix strix]
MSQNRQCQALFVQNDHFGQNRGGLGPKHREIVKVLEKHHHIPSAYFTVGNTDNPARWLIHILSQLKADNKGLQVALSGLDLLYANNGQDRVTNLTNFRNDVGNFIDEHRVRQSIQNNRFIRLHPNVSRNIDRAMGIHLVILSNLSINDSRYNIQEIGEEDF